jgi:hypothetical protein
MMETMRDIGQKVMGKNREEGQTTKRMEQMTAALPSSTWLTLAGGAIVASLALKILGRDSTANFVGEWAPTFLILGLYNKIVKVMGSERREAGAF